MPAGDPDARRRRRGARHRHVHRLGQSLEGRDHVADRLPRVRAQRRNVRMARLARRLPRRAASRSAKARRRRPGRPPSSRPNAIRTASAPPRRRRATGRLRASRRPTRSPPPRRVQVPQPSRPLPARCAAGPVGASRSSTRIRPRHPDSARAGQPTSHVRFRLAPPTVRTRPHRCPEQSPTDQSACRVE